MKILKLNNIVKAFDRVILNKIKLEIDEGDYIAIVGKSGAGKSTLMNIIGLLEPFDEGEYLYKNKLISTEKDKCMIRRDEIGFIFQSFNLLNTLNIKENIILPTLYSSKEIIDLENLCKELDINKLLEKFPDQLSGGERQRVAIARALIHNPSILLADEPTGNLDINNRDIVLNILKEENAQGKTIILITHDLEAAKSANRIIRIANGELVYD